MPTYSSSSGGCSPRWRKHVPVPHGRGHVVDQQPHLDPDAAFGCASLMPSSPPADDAGESRWGARLAPSRMHRAGLGALVEDAGHLQRHYRPSNSVPRWRLGRRKFAVTGHPPGREQVGNGFGVVAPVDPRQERVPPTPQPAYGGERGLGVHLGLEHVDRQQVEQLVPLTHLPLLHQTRGHVAAGAVEPGPQPCPLDLLGRDQDLARRAARECSPALLEVVLGGLGDRGEAALAPLRPAGLDRGDAEGGVLVAHAAPHREHQVGERGQQVLRQVHAAHEAHVRSLGVAAPHTARRSPTRRRGAAGGGRGRAS